MGAQTSCSFAWIAREISCGRSHLVGQERRQATQFDKRRTEASSSRDRLVLESAATKQPRGSAGLMYGCCDSMGRETKFGRRPLVERPTTVTVLSASRLPLTAVSWWRPTPHPRLVAIRPAKLSDWRTF